MHPRTREMFLRLAAIWFLLAGTASQAIADAGVFTGNGQSLHQITSKSVQLVNIDVTIILGRGPFLFDTTVAGMDQAEYDCTFVLRNLSAHPETVQVGFPVDSQFAQGDEAVSEKDSRDWVLDYGFIARDDKTTYHVEFVRRKPESGPGQFRSVFVWNMRFAAKETKTLSVHYHIPISMGLVSTFKDPRADFSRDEVLSQELMNVALLETTGYITSTGSSWAGKVEDATFTVVVGRFERYLDRRGITEEDTSAEDAKTESGSLPVRYPWWFRKIAPAGWQEKDGAIQWHYKNFKPKAPIEVRYYLTQLPKSPGEVDVFVNRFLKRLESGEKATRELRRLRQVLLATYGKEPEDDVAKSFASMQLWYAPQKDFSMARLTEDQRAVLKQLDERIQAAEKAK